MSEIFCSNCGEEISYLCVDLYEILKQYYQYCDENEIQFPYWLFNEYTHFDYDVSLDEIRKIFNVDTNCDSFDIEFNNHSLRLLLWKNLYKEKYNDIILSNKLDNLLNKEFFSSIYNDDDFKQLLKALYKDITYGEDLTNLFDKSKGKSTILKFKLDPDISNRSFNKYYYHHSDEQIFELTHNITTNEIKGFNLLFNELPTLFQLSWEWLNEIQKNIKCDINQNELSDYQLDNVTIVDNILTLKFDTNLLIYFLWNSIDHGESDISFDEFKDMAFNFERQSKDTVTENLNLLERYNVNHLYQLLLKIYHHERLNIPSITLTKRYEDGIFLGYDYQIGNFKSELYFICSDCREKLLKGEGQFEEKTIVVYGNHSDLIEQFKEYIHLKKYPHIQYVVSRNITDLANIKINEQRYNCKFIFVTNDTKKDAIPNIQICDLMLFFVDKNQNFEVLNKNLYNIKNNNSSANCIVVHEVDKMDFNSSSLAHMEYHQLSEYYDTQKEELSHTKDLNESIKNFNVVGMSKDDYSNSFLFDNILYSLNYIQPLNQKENLFVNLLQENKDHESKRTTFNQILREPYDWLEDYIYEPIKACYTSKRFEITGNIDRVLNDPKNQFFTDPFYYRYFYDSMVDNYDIRNTIYKTDCFEKINRYYLYSYKLNSTGNNNEEIKKILLKKLEVTQENINKMYEEYKKSVDKQYACHSTIKKKYERYPVWESFFCFFVGSLSTSLYLRGIFANYGNLLLNLAVLFTFGCYTIISFFRWIYIFFIDDQYNKVIDSQNNLLQRIEDEISEINTSLMKSSLPDFFNEYNELCKHKIAVLEEKKIYLLSDKMINRIEFFYLSLILEGIFIFILFLFICSFIFGYY